MSCDIDERTSGIRSGKNSNDTLESTSPRLTWVIVVVGRAIAAAASVGVVYLGLEQTYWAWMIVQNPESVPMPLIDPTLFIFLTILATGVALVSGWVGLLVAFTARITDIGAVVGGDSK